mgnify:CR=1 FL=1|jgi:hypothetical protein
MDVASYQFQEQRLPPLSNVEHWENTSAEQKIALYDLHRYGYRLLFVRKTANGPLAVIAQNDDIAVVDPNGSLTLQHQITLRQSE